MNGGLLNVINMISNIKFFLVFCSASFLLLFNPPLANSEVEVTTLGGGPVELNGPAYGDRDGDTLNNAQFNYPVDCIGDKSGKYLYVVDQNNKKIKRLDLEAGQTKSYITNLYQPTGISIIENDRLIISTINDIRLYQIIYENAYLKTIEANITGAIAVTFDEKTNIYVACTNGNIWQLSTNLATKRLITRISGKPSGIAALQNGQVAVSDSDNHVIWRVNPINGLVDTLAGKINNAGFADGPADSAQFNQPAGIAIAPNGNLVVADQQNHRIRIILPDGFVATLCGIDSSFWGGNYPGWWDGPSEYAECRLPTGITVSSDGTIYFTEVYYHLVRKATGAALLPSGTSGGPNAFSISVPTLSVTSGLYPMGLNIIVTNNTQSPLLDIEIFYTTDGTQPTTNSLKAISLNNSNLWIIPWSEHDKDLSYLKVCAIGGSYSSEVVSGSAVNSNSLGIPQGIYGNIQASCGSMAVVPVVVNLKPGTQVKTLQFKLTVSNGSVTGLSPSSLTVLDINPDLDLIPITPVYTNPPNILVSKQINGLEMGVVFDINSGLLIDKSAVVLMLGVGIPINAAPGDNFYLSITNISATSDGNQSYVQINAMPQTAITVSNLKYLAGDSAFRMWYGAGDFGDFSIDNSDVNAALLVMLGLKTCYPNTDLFDSMDVFPLDENGRAGGDGIIRYLDWQVLLMRSLNITSPDLPGATLNWLRQATTSGRIAMQYSIANATPLKASTIQTLSSQFNTWNPDVKLTVQSVTNVSPGAEVTLPVSVSIAQNKSLQGLSFKAMVISESGKVIQDIKFIPNKNIVPQPSINTRFSFNSVICAWSIVNGSGLQALKDNQIIGWLSIKLPTDVAQGDSFSIHFSADGAADLQTPLNIETFPGAIWIQSIALRPVEKISDEWKIKYFGSWSNPIAAADADPDGDGVPNIVEYNNRTDPMDLRLRFVFEESGIRKIRWIRWNAKPLSKYVVRFAPNISNDQWSDFAVVSNNSKEATLMDLDVSSKITDATGFFQILEEKFNGF